MRSVKMASAFWGIGDYLKRPVIVKTDGQILVEPAGHRQKVDRLDAGEIGCQEGQAGREESREQFHDSSIHIL